MSLSTVRSSNSAILKAASTSPKRPVGVFVGGTSGIGAAMASAFATHTDGNADIVIVGRNREAGEALLRAMPAPSGEPAPRREFVACDATLMRDVGRVTAELRTRYPTVNYMVLTPGVMTLNGRDETDEGIDRKLALHYYSRWRFIHDLAPQLQAAKDAGEDAKTLSVLGAGFGGPIDVNDLGLKKGFSVRAAASHGITYNDCMNESFAAKHPAVSFIQSQPGFVTTPLASRQSGLVGILGMFTNVIGAVAGTPPAASAEYMWQGLLKAEPGASLVGRKGQTLPPNPYTNGVLQALWEHTVAATGVTA